MKTAFVSKVQESGRICLGDETMKALDVKVGEYVQLIINPQGPEVKIQKVVPYNV